MTTRILFYESIHAYQLNIPDFKKFCGEIIFEEKRIIEKSEKTETEFFTFPPDEKFLEQTLFNAALLLLYEH